MQARIYLAVVEMLYHLPSRHLTASSMLGECGAIGQFQGDLVTTDYEKKEKATAAFSYKATYR